MKLALRIIAILSFIGAIVWLIVDPGFEPLLAFLAGVTSLITSYVIDKPQNETETLDQRNRRIMLNHVEEFWVKGILEKSLYGAALLDLGIKEDPDTLNYPWTIKRESTQESLPLGKPMLEIFQEIGLGRSLLILGAPGSGKTTMLLELTRQLIERARQDDTEPIPVVFNLASWTDKQSLAEWLASELNAIYSIPKKMAPEWVTGNGMLLLLDGLDEVQQDSRDKCVSAINHFRKEHGLTSVAVCNRSQDYSELNTRLAFDGAIELQPLNQRQVKAYFKRFGERLTGIKQVLKKDTALNEMAETPLFLSIMTLAYQNKQGSEILVFQDVYTQRKLLFSTYVNRMFDRPGRSQAGQFNKRDTLHWISWLAIRMINHNHVSFLIDHITPNWLTKDERERQPFNRLKMITWMIVILMSGIMGGLIGGLGSMLIFGLISKLIGGLMGGMIGGLIGSLIDSTKVMGNLFRWSRKAIKPGATFGLIFGLIFGLMAGLMFQQIIVLILIGGLFFGWIILMKNSRLWYKHFNKSVLMFGLISGLMVGQIFWQSDIQSFGLIFFVGLFVGLIFAGAFSSRAPFRYYTLRWLLARYNYLPSPFWKLVPFLDYCVDLIFLRRVGGGYIFVHRMLMEHFAEMYNESEQTYS